MYQIKGKIQRIELEGGFWGIIDINTEKKYLPDEELPKDFQNEGLLVEVTFEPSTLSSIYQWGRMIHILDMKDLTDEKTED